MKASTKRRRSKAQILHDKQAALQKEQEIKEKLAAWDDLEKALEESEKEKEKMKNKYGRFKEIFENGLVKQNDHGIYEVVNDPAEREYIKQEKSKKKMRKTMTAAEAEMNSNILSNMEQPVDEYHDF
jgi:hypothetical protein